MSILPKSHTSSSERCICPSRGNLSSSGSVRKFVIKPHLVVALFALSVAAPAVRRLERYALVLKDAPLGRQVASRMDLASTGAVNSRARILRSQLQLTHELEQRGIRIPGSTHTILNAVFVAVTEDQVDQLSRMPGVVSVHHLRPLKRTLNTALDLVNVPAAWNSIGGRGDVGRRVEKPRRGAQVVEKK